MPRRRTFITAVTDSIPPEERETFERGLELLISHMENLNQQKGIR
jgi:hypothetical protein